VEENLVKINFSYSDEYKQETSLNKTLTQAVIEESSTFDVLVDEFKLFLLASGFDSDSVSKIKIDED
jgi:hypothetical protein